MAKKVIDKLMLNWVAYQTAYGSTLTIQKNWTTVDSVNLNASSDKTINISVPTNSDYVDLTSAQSVWGVKTFTSAPVVPSKTTEATNSWTAVATEAQVYAVKNAIPSVDASISSSSTNPVQNKVVKQYVDDAVWAITWIDFQIVAELPATWVKWVIYLVSNSGTTPNAYDEYIWITSTSSFEKIWSTTVDLSNYATLNTAQTFTAVKTFSAEPVLPSKTTAATNTGTKPATEAQVYTVAQSVSTLDWSVVKTSWNQTIAWTKTFSISPVVPSKTSDATNSGTSIATEAQVYKKLDSSDLWNATITFNQAWTSIGSLTTNQSSNWSINIHDNIPATQAEYDALLPWAATDWNTYLIYSSIA